ncbi:hypothetical protein [uncultured Draconibacterium sp.]|uniref:hypothetical protein n=1 Tax=uncultured Draconibacterium sp. TaxID=1573823 RepID=UPI0032167C2C
METKEVKYLLQRYFNGESTEAEERRLEEYFQAGNIAEEVAEYAEFFGGISELASVAGEETIEEDVMDFILENEHQEKTKYRSMWKMVTGIAASIIIVLGSFLVYQEQQKPFDDTFKNPDEAYAYATQTLGFISGKYNKGLAELSNFDKLKKANKSIKKSTEPVIEFYKGVESLNQVKQDQHSEIDSL